MIKRNGDFQLNIVHVPVQISQTLFEKFGYFPTIVFPNEFHQIELEPEDKKNFSSQIFSTKRRIYGTYINPLDDVMPNPEKIKALINYPLPKKLGEK